MEYALAAISIVSGLVAFFHDRTGNASGGISILGWTLIALIVAGGAGSGWLAYSKNEQSKLADARERELIKEQRLAQSMLMMQFVDLDRPFEYANFNMNIEYLLDENGESIHPYASDTLGTFPIDIVKDGGEIAVFSFEPRGLDHQAYRFTRRGNQIGVSRRARVDVPEYLFSSDNLLEPEISGLAQGDEVAFTWGFEFLATVFGSFAQGPSLDTNPRAGEYLSKLIKQRYLGYLRFPGQDRNSSLRSLINNHTNTHIRLIQSHTSALSESCTRSVYFYVDLIDLEDELERLERPLSNAVRETYFQCRPRDLCFLFVSQQPMDVQPCELPVI